MRDSARKKDLLGQAITLNGRPHRVIGVMPPGFGFPAFASAYMSVNSAEVLDDAPEFWIPRATSARPAGPETGGMTLRSTLAMLAPGVTVEQARAEANTLYLGRFLQALLFGVTPGDPLTLAAVAVLFAAVAGVATYVPARRATRVDPLTALAPNDQLPTSNSQNARLGVGVGSWELASWALTCAPSCRPRRDDRRRLPNRSARGRG